MKPLLFWGKIVKICAKIARNWKILSVCIFVDELAQRFDLLYFIALLNTLDMFQSCIGQDFTILRQNSQILCKIHNKLENIISIHVRRWNGIKFGRGLFKIILALISSCIGQYFTILGKIVKFCAKIMRNLKILSVFIFVGELAQMFAPWYFISLLKTLAVCFKSE